MISKLEKNKHRMGFFLSLPGVLFVFTFIIYPLFSNLHNSFYDYNLLRSRDMVFIGLKNYQALLTESFFNYSVIITILFTLISVCLETIIGLAISIFFTFIIKENNQGVLRWLQKGTRSILIIPWAIPGVVAASTWRLLFHPIYSPINSVLGKQIMWLTHPTLAFVSILVAETWKTTPYFIFFFSAAIMAIPLSQFEAARIDGASKWQEIRHILLPGLLPIIIVAASFRLIDTFTRIFDVVYVLTGGGPGNATKVLPILIQETGLKFFKYGLASSMAVVSVIISVFFGLALLRRGK